LAEKKEETLMKNATSFAVVIMLTLAVVPVARAQCGARLLAALDEESQTFDVSVWTNSPHCPASGQIHIETMPSGMILFPSGDPWWVESFFDVFTTPHTIKPQVVPTAPESFFDVFTEVTFDDSAYSPLSFVEHVRVNPLNQLEIVHSPPCAGDAVPPSMTAGVSYCFHVCHRVYTIPLVVPPSMGQPLITVSPGCAGPPADSCVPDPACPPGDMNSFRYEVYQTGGLWYLEFEYSNPAMEPVCYCVRYEGNLPYGYEVNTLAVMNAEMQTLDLTVWTNNPLYTACGIMEVFSYPPGAYISIPSQEFTATSEPHTWHIPIAAGTFDAGDTCMLIAHYDANDCQDNGVPDICDPEFVIYSTQKGARTLRPEISCDPSAYVPSSLELGVPECMIVCHDIYYIPLVFPGPGVPTVSVSEGCRPTLTPCSNPLCSPGLPGEYRYDVIRVGGTWFLEFEHSNPQHVPACYCVTLNAVAPREREPYLLTAMDETHQTFNVSLWSSDCEWPWNGHFTVTTNPPYELDPDAWVESFFDVYCAPHTWEFPVHPAADVLPGENFEIIIECDFFGPGSDPFEGQVAYREPVIVTPAGTIAPWNPEPPCTGDHVPTSMVPGESQCFKVCHHVYETILYYNPGGGRPIIHVTPGCLGPPHDSCAAEACVPGGPNDFVYDVYHNGVDWVLRFEYSNPYIEPVCYCVTYAGNVPWDCETFELAALDEDLQEFDVSLRTYSYGSYDCPASGTVNLFSFPSGAYIPQPTWAFAGVGDEWYTIEAAVGPGSFVAGDTFQLVAYVDYTDPEYPDKWLTEEVIVEPSGQYLRIRDVGGECAAGGGDNVPAAMAPGQSECFHVCHRVYHIALAATDPLNPPTVTITPGCFGPPRDPCVPDPACTSGGPFDYRWRVWWTGGYWELEFEYSNENIEPVCYCVTVAAPPPVCDTHALVALDEDNQLLKVSIVSLNPSGTEPCEVSGTVTLSSDPPGMYFEQSAWTFSGVGETWVTWDKPSAPEPYNPIIVDTIIVEIDYDDPAQPDVIETEMVTMDLTSGGLVIHDAGGECAAGGGPNVPEALTYGQPACFVVCHDIYYIPLELMATVMPTVTVYPGCGPSTPCNDPVPCTPGGPYDYRYNVFRVGGTWILEFEYSNENIEPVCYCVEVTSAPPVPYEAYLLAALDEVHQLLDVTLWTSPGAPLADGTMLVTAEPGLTTDVAFTGVGLDYQTWTFPVDSGALADSQTFQLAVVVLFNDPVFGRLHYEETVIVTAAGTLRRWDPITPCVGNLVPATMNDNSAECFVVCHKIYDIVLNAPPTPLPPVITASQGCFGPPHDHCPPPVVCRQGGPMDYCYRFWFDGVFWHLIFEYSNPYKEPVCYCVTVGVVPCLPVTDLVIQWPDTLTNEIRLGWTCPQWGQYIIYYTTNKNNDGNPPGTGWHEEGRVIGNASDVLTWQPPSAVTDAYRNYVVKVDCNPTRTRR
jgi:hypothetical protein